jgi:ABC-2 type transport system ATP-binding protein
MQNGMITFSVPQGEKFLPQLMNGFQSRLLSIGIRRPTLDDVFIKLTGRAIRDEEAGLKEQMKTIVMMRGHGR